MSSTIHIEGGLLTHDGLAALAAGTSEWDGLKPQDYWLSPHERVGDAANRSWARLLVCWRSLQGERAKVAAADGGAGAGAGGGTSNLTALTRERWLVPLFQELGYGRLTRAKLTASGQEYAISHVWVQGQSQVPIHLLGMHLDLDKRQAKVAGAAKASPHGLMQDFLNRSDDHLWGIVSNGLTLRLLRDHHSLTRMAFVAFDLEAMMDGERFSDFLLLWMLCHASRLEARPGDAPAPAADTADASDDADADPDTTHADAAGAARAGAALDPARCWLERWLVASQKQGVRALDGLRDGVQRAIASLGTGFLAHPSNDALRDALRAGRLDVQGYYRQLLRLVYRLIFLFVAEERDALLDPAADDAARDRYRRFYALGQLRRLADRRRGSAHADLWQRVALVMGRLHDGEPMLGLPALGSWLWRPDTCGHLMDSACDNSHLLDAIRALCWINHNKRVHAVNWRHVGAEELGSVYESLLELSPQLSLAAARFSLDVAPGHDRKTTGSYYTPAALVEHLLDTALDPVLDAAARAPDPAAAILALTICDPSCGSGHFLLAAARRVAARLAAVRDDDPSPSPASVRRALRDVIGRCIHGVDINPMAVELCKVSLWLEALEPGRPLAFLDSHIQHGDALFGATPALLARGIPLDAFKPLTGDDKDVAKRVKARHKRALTPWLKRQQAPASPLTPIERAALARSTPTAPAFTEVVQRVERAPDATLSDVRLRESGWREYLASPEHRDAKRRADAWCAAFAWPLTPESEASAPTHDVWTRLHEPAFAATREALEALSQRFHFFHWHLAFPHVFGPPSPNTPPDDPCGWSGGFDVLLGNPPWERVKLQEKEWFASRAPDIANASNKAERQRLINALATDHPHLLHAWNLALHDADAQSHFIRTSNRYPLCGVGDVNTYAIFSELNRSLILSKGCCGFIVPSGIATDYTTRNFFVDIVSKDLLELLEFENNGFFSGAGQGHMVRFALITLSQVRPKNHRIRFLFQGQSTDDAKDDSRTFFLDADDISIINPNTLTCPIFRSHRDAEITKSIYRRLPILIREGTPDVNPWDVSFSAMFHMANDSHLFSNNLRESSDVPLYEAKYIQIYNHRFGDFGMVEPGSKGHILPPVPLEKTQDPHYKITSRYWVSKTEVKNRLSNRWQREWLLGWRDVTDSRASARTTIAAIIPRVGSGDTFLLAFPKVKDGYLLLACWCSFIFDYIARQSLGGIHFKYHVMKQLPVIPPERFEGVARWEEGRRLGEWVRERVLELTYTAWDLEGFGRDCGYEGPPFRWDEGRRFELRCELDAAFFRLYGVERSDVEYIMGTFPIVERQDVKAHGRYRTRDRILAIYDALGEAMMSGVAYRSGLNPPPAHPSQAHPP